MRTEVLEETEPVSLCEALDRLLNTGVAIHGDIVISVADIDLIYLGLRALLASVEAAARAGLPMPRETIARRG